MSLRSLLDCLVGCAMCAEWVLPAIGLAAGQVPESQPTGALVVASRPAIPVLAVDKTEHDFGQIWSGQKLEHKFRIANLGTADLKITSVRPSCGCMTASQYPRVLAPGASGEFPFTLNTRAFSKQFSKSISISSNDPGQPELRLVLKGQAKAQVSVEPRRADFGSVYGDQVQTRTVMISNNLETPLRVVLDPLATAGPWTFDLSEKQPGRTYELTVRFDPKTVPAGFIQRTARLLTNFDMKHEILIPAFATVRNRIEVSPNPLTIAPPSSQPANMEAGALPVASRPATRERTIRIQNYGARPVKALDVTTSDPSLVATLREEAAGESYIVSVVLPLAFAASATSAITVRTDDPEKPMIRIPVVTREPVRPAVSTSQLVGQPAPAFRLTTLGGESVSDQDFKGVVFVLDFFSPSCGFCKKQMPRVEALRKTYEPKGVRFLFVSERMGKRELAGDEILAELDGLGVAGPAAIDSSNAMGQRFGVHNYPTIVVIGADGLVKAVTTGNIGDLESIVSSQIESLLAGKSLAHRD